MKAAEKATRQSLSLPTKLAKQVGAMSKDRELRKNRMLLELIETGIEAEKRKRQEFIALSGIAVTVAHQASCPSVVFINASKRERKVPMDSSADDPLADHCGWEAKS